MTAQPYFTTDTAFAAFLLTSGSKLLSIELDADPVTFCFDQNGTSFKELEFQWKSGIAQGNIPSFFKAYRNFIDEIKRSR